MPRCARNIMASGFYHIMIRGVNKDIIFREDEDRELFLRLLYYYKNKLKCKIHTYCLMDNHVHILFEDKESSISDFMRDVTSQYASEFNKKYKRVGHLYQERFKSEVVYDDIYLMRLIRYIHRNPEKAGICKTEDYKWSSYREYMNKPFVIEREYILSKFDIEERKAIKKFSEFILDSKNEKIDKLFISKKLSDEQAVEIIKYVTKIDNILEIRKYKKEERNKVINKISTIKNLNDNQIARVLQISKNFRNNSIIKR
ncbi:MAG: transposase [Clostridia bacterium]